MSYIPPNPNGQATSANSAPVVIASDQSALANDIQFATPQLVSGSGAALNAMPIPATEVKGSFVAVQFTGTFSATYAFEQSNDGTNWVNAPLVDQVNTNNLALTATNGATNYMFAGAVAGRYFRVRISAYTSGTVNATAVFSAMPKSSNHVNVGGQINPSSDTLSPSGTSVTTADYNLAYNGTNWSRIRTASAAAATTGTGVPAAGVLGFDGTNYQRLKTDSAGVLNVSVASGSGTQITDGTQSANTIASDTGQNALLTAGGRKEVTFSTTTAQAVAATDVGNYRWVSLHITSQGTSSTVTFQVSNDNTNWVSTVLLSPQATAQAVQTSTTSTGIFHGPLTARYFRVNVTGISAGTTAGIINFMAHASTLQTMGMAAT